MLTFKQTICQNVFRNTVDSCAMIYCYNENTKCKRNSLRTENVYQHKFIIHIIDFLKTRSRFSMIGKRLMFNQTTSID